MQRKYLEMFLEEGADILSGLDQCILGLEQHGPHEETVQEALRLAHTLKGGAKMVGLGNVSQIAHRMESELKEAVAGGSVPPREVRNRFLGTIERIREALQLVGDGREAEALALDLSTARLADVGKENESGAGKAPGVVGGVEVSERRLGTDRMRVGIEKLDNLQNLVDDLTLHKFRLLEHMRQLEKDVKTLEKLSWSSEGRELYPREQQQLMGALKTMSGRRFAAFLEDMHRLDHMVGEVQEQVFDLRMVPLVEVLEEYHRAARKLASELGKEVSLSIDGKFTEMDKRLLEAVQGPLMHLVRNAVDHGVEMPGEREIAGKPPTASVVIRAYHKGTAVVIEVEDDGRGLDLSEIREIAVRRGLLSSADAEMMADTEVPYLLCEPGFTTRESVTEVSGRGVGLDVVKAGVEKLKGSLTIHSETGRGSRFRMYLPLSISSLSVLTVQVSGVSFAIPSLFVDRCFRVDAAGLAARGGNWRYGDKILPVVSLARLLGVESPRPPAKVYLVVVHYRGKQMLLQVDSLDEEREVVLKPLGNHLREVVYVLGISFLPNGDPIPILNVIDLHSRWSSLEVTGRFRMEAVKAQPAILVVDDSMTTRHMETTLLQSLGYRVMQASDGVEAWGLLQQQEIDLVLTDIEMPRMNGLELTRKIRDEESKADLPVVMVSTRSSDRDQEEGFLAGADAYISKEHFNQRELGETLRGLLQTRRSEPLH